jgi:hypothetical protein
LHQFCAARRPGGASNHRKSTRDRPKGAGEGSAVTSSTWITMIVVMAFVWGGFALALVLAVRKESGKSGSD